MSPSLSSTLRVCLLLSLAALLSLGAAGCEKQRIYPTAAPNTGATQPDPTATLPPPGAHAQESGQQPGAQEASPQQASTQQAPAAQATQQAVVRAEDLGESLEPETGLLEGRAAVFDDELIGFPMAGGGQYDPDDLVAAHRNLPLGSLVEVRSVATGRSVRLTVADRGPYEKDVVLNVSRRAAGELGIADGGEVTLKLVGGHATAPAPTSAGAAPTGTIGTATAQTPPAQTPAAAQVSEAVAGKVFWVQVGAFGDEGNAEAALDVLRQRGYAGSRVIAPSAGSGVSRVQAGPFALREDASRALESLRADYPAAFVVTPD